MLLRLADTIEKQVELKRKVKSAMTYPVAVGCIVVLIVTAMLLFIVPMFEDLYTDLGGTLPVPDADADRRCRVDHHVLVGDRARRSSRRRSCFRRWVDTAERSTACGTRSS